MSQIFDPQFVEVEASNREIRASLRHERWNVTTDHIVYLMTNEREKIALELLAVPQIQNTVQLHPDDILLRTAIQRSSRKAIDAILPLRGHIDLQADNVGMTTFEFACHLADPRIVSRLINAGAVEYSGLVDAPWPRGPTMKPNAIQLAIGDTVSNGDLRAAATRCAVLDEILYRLRPLIANPRRRASVFNSYLTQAIESGNDSSFASLVGFGGFISPDHIGYDLLLKAIRSDNPFMVRKFFLLAPPSPPVPVDHKLLLVAAGFTMPREKRNHFEIMKILVSNGVPLRDRPDADGTALTMAISDDNAEMVGWLLLQGVDLATNSWKTPFLGGYKNARRMRAERRFAARTAFHYVKGVAVLQLLVEKGLDVSGSSSDDVLPIQIMSIPDDLSSERLEMLKFLLDRMDDVDARNVHGQTPLLFCCQKRAPWGAGVLEWIEHLISRGANVMIASEDGVSALDAVSANAPEHLDTFRAMIDEQAKLGQAQHDGTAGYLSSDDSSKETDSFDDSTVEIIITK
jgi:ankyrin repeat protein